MGDVAEFDIECVVQHIGAKLQGQQYVMVITAGPPCPDFSSIRDNPRGTEGTSGWLFKHMLGVEHQLRKRFRNIPIETVFENVVPHPAVRDNLLELTTPLAMAPIVVDASSRDRLALGQLRWKLGIDGNRTADDIPHGNTRVSSWSPCQMDRCLLHPCTIRRLWTPAMRTVDPWHWAMRGTSRLRFGSCSSSSWAPSMQRSP